MLRAYFWISFLTLLASNSAPAAAGYDQRCMESLMLSGNWLSSYRNVRAHRLRDRLHLKRGLTPIETEAVSDILHDLVLIVRFQNGKSAVFASDELSEAKLSGFLRGSEMAEVRYTPAALARVRDVLKRGCEVLSRPGCELYESFENITDEGERPFTARQELCLKWATLHMEPTRNLFESIGAARGNIELRRLILTMVERPAHSAAKLVLRSCFGPGEVVRLYERMVGPHLNGAFDQFSDAMSRRGQ